MYISSQLHITKEVGTKTAILQNIIVVNNTLAATCIFIRQIKVYISGQLYITKEVDIKTALLQNIKVVNHILAITYRFIRIADTFSNALGAAFSMETFSRNVQIVK